MARTVEVPDFSASHGSSTDAIARAIFLMESALAKRSFTIPRTSRVYLEMRRDLPYVLNETRIPDTQILVNRNYKPLGNNSRAHENWVEYEAFTNLHVHLAPHELDSVVSTGRERGLFGDENPPWASRVHAVAYLERLKRLIALVG